MPKITHAIYENSAIAQAYIGEISDVEVSVQDNNVPTAADSVVQTAKQDDAVVSALSSGVIAQNGTLTLALQVLPRPIRLPLRVRGMILGLPSLL